MSYFHGKIVGKIQKWLEEFTVRGCCTVTISKKTIQSLWFENFSGFFAC